MQARSPCARHGTPVALIRNQPRKRRHREIEACPIARRVHRHGRRRDRRCTDHAPHRHDRRRHPRHHQPARLRLRRQPVRRAHAVRRPDDVGPVLGRQAERDHPGARHRVEGRRQGQDEVDLQAAQGREVPRRHRLQRRRRDLQLREGAQEGRAALRRAPGGPDHPADADHHRRAQDRRLHDRGADLRARRVRADQPRQPLHGEPGGVGEDEELDRVRQEPGGDSGPWKFVRLVPRERMELEKNTGLLESAARAEDRPPGADPDAGIEHARRRAPLRPGRLDRGAAVGRDPAAAREGLPDHVEPVPAHLAVAAQHAPRRPDRRQARAPGDAALRGSRRPAAPARLHGAAGEGRRVRGPSLVRQAEVRHQVRPGAARRSCSPTPATARASRST